MSASKTEENGTRRSTRVGKTQTSRKVVALTQALAPVAAAVEAEIDEDRLVPRICLGEPVSVTARRLGQILRKEPVFLTPGRVVVTVDLNTGERQMLTPVRFTSWVEEYVEVGRLDSRGEFHRGSMAAEMAAKILAADQFTCQLRFLRATVAIRIPGWANAERTAVRLLPAGYDEQTQMLILDTVPIDEGMDANAGLLYLREIHERFPWVDGGVDLFKSRAFSGHIVSCLTHFCSALRGSCNRPAFVYLANQQGSGKSLLAQIAIAATHGPAIVSSFSTDEGERGKVLTSWAAEGRQYVFLDNLKGHLSSVEMEGFLSSAFRSGRILGKSESITAPNLVQVTITGNGLTLSPDLLRRAVVVEIFCAGEAVNRTFPSVLTDSQVGSTAFRSRMLSSMWALVREWSELGCPGTERRDPPGRLLPSFEDFSRLMGGITGAVGLADPFAASDTGIDEEGAAWRSVLQALAADVPTEESRDFTTAEVLAKLEELGLDAVVIGSKSKSPVKTLGRRIRPWLGRQLVDSAGRAFEFGARRQANYRSYRIRFIDKT